MIISISDGSIVKFVKYGDKNITPYALAVSSSDRLAFNSKVGVSNSIYFYDSSITSNNLVITHWDSILSELLCPQFAWDASSYTFTMTPLLTTALPVNVPKYKT